MLFANVLVRECHCRVIQLFMYRGILLCWFYFNLAFFSLIFALLVNIWHRNRMQILIFVSFRVTVHQVFLWQVQQSLSSESISVLTFFQEVYVILISHLSNSSDINCHAQKNYSQWNACIKLNLTLHIKHTDDFTVFYS